MRQMVIQYPDGKYHTIQATRFYGVLINGKEEYILEYDDLTTSTRNCFTVLDREDNTFVKRPLASQIEYSVLAARIRFMQKKFYDINLLPGKIGLCNAALEVLNPSSPPVDKVPENKSQTVINLSEAPRIPRTDTQKRRVVIIYVDVAVNHDFIPYYLDASTARALGLSSCTNGYYHLTLNEIERIKDNYDIQYKNAALGLGFGRVLVHESENHSVAVSTDGSTPSPKNEDNEYVVYEDIAPIREEYPFYLAKQDAARCHLYTDKEYYHLRKDELYVLNRFATIRIEKKVLAILDQKDVKQEDSQVQISEPVSLTPHEMEILEELFDKLVDFEDYYSFFGIEDLSDSSPSQVLNDPRVVNLTILFQKGAACRNEYAINFVEFLDNFKKTLKVDSLNK